jgi:putative phosphoesterase
MKHIAIISDTHGILREPVIAELDAANCIIHAGDIDTASIADAVRMLGETYMVRGNNDMDWAKELPASISVTMEGVRFFIVHNRKDVPQHLSDVDVVIYGHSHKYLSEVIDGVLYLNPGSCGKRRFNMELTMSRMTVEAGKYQYEKVIIPHD